MHEHTILLIKCSDNIGLVAKITNYIHSIGANIVKLDQHSSYDKDPYFFMRVEFSFETENVEISKIEADLSKLTKEINACWEIYYRSKKARMGILVSKEDHCLVDLLFRWKNKELVADIAFVISNHNIYADFIKSMGLDFYYINSEDKKLSEQKILELAKNKTDFLVLARYMQILSEDFLNQYGNDIINIHHSFLPSFKGANPYRQAYEKGVKLIGATAHYVSNIIDEGPIISQMVDRVSFKDSVDDLKKKGKNIEKITLAKAVEYHVEHRMIKYKNKTIVFD